MNVANEPGAIPSRLVGDRGNSGWTRCRRVWLWAGMVLIAAWARPVASAGGLKPYLPRVGPVPLRFEEPFPESSSKFSLPPLDLGLTNSTTSIDNLPLPYVPAPPESTVEVDLGQDSFVRVPWSPEGLPDPRPTPPTPPPPAIVPTPVPEPAPEPPPLVQPMTVEQDAISPRVLLPYLNRGGQPNSTTSPFLNTNGVQFVAPIGFEPPAPGRSSSATYNVTPPSSK